MMVKDNTGKLLDIREVRINGCSGISALSQSNDLGRDVHNLLQKLEKGAFGEDDACRVPIQQPCCR